MKAIFHADKNWGIGKNNELMFSLPKDMKFFREKTKGKVVVMGNKTLRSFPGGKPLKDRINIVLTHEAAVDGAIIVHNLEELFETIKGFPSEEVYLIGGASLYHKLLPYCTEALVTKVDCESCADVFAPNLDLDPNFQLIYESETEIDNGYRIKFCTYWNRKVKEM